MNILLTGGTGLLGRALCAALLDDGHQLTVLSRQPALVSRLCGPAVTAFASLDDWRADMHFDAVINLAGEPIIDAPWTEGRKQRIWASRVTLTEQLLAAIQRAETKPSVLLSASAIGVYGDCGDTPCDDANPLATAAEDFGANLCAAWENAANPPNASGMRVYTLRTGLVLAREGGLLKRLRRPFSLGLGTRLGNGQQWMSWIHIEDWLNAVRFLLQAPGASGAFNLTAPQPVRNSSFTAALAKALHRPAFFVTPAFALRLALGQRAYLLLGGQRVLPTRLQSLGFNFRYAELDEALRVLV